MTKSKKRVLILLSLTFLIASLMTVIVNTYAEAEADFVFSAVLQEKYKYGDTVEIPSATYGGEKVDFIVNLPDGTATSKSTIKLNKTGVYTVNYIAKKSGSEEYAKKSFSFSVYNQMFSVVGNGYTEFRKINDRVGGLYANLEKGDTLVYNDIIDLNDFDNDEMLFKMAILAANSGDADIDQFEVRLTDIYDENIYLVYRVKRYIDDDTWATSVSYVDCGFGTLYSGFEDSSVGQFKYTYGGENHTLKAHVNTEKYGTPTMISMTGGTAVSPFAGDNMFGFSLDMVSGHTFVKLCNFGENPHAPRLIADVNNENLFGEKFSGFTDGKVKISFTPTKFNKTDCGFFFSEIGGNGIGEDNWNMLETSIAPSIDVDMGEYTVDNAPSSAKGLSYRVFDAKAADILDGALNCDVKVFYGYSNANKIRINVKNGYFKTDYIGEYTIEYTATNSSGNKTVVLVKLNCVELDGELGFALQNENAYGAVNVGESVKLFDSFTAENYLGNPKLYVECKLDGGDVVYTIDENNSFVPYYAGTYTIKYTLRDFVSEKTVEKKLTVNKADAVYYEVCGQLPQYLVKNGIYDLKIVKAYSLSSGTPVEVPVKCFVLVDDSATETEVTGNYTVTANSKVKAVLKADVAFASDNYSVEKQVIDMGLGGSINKSRLFVPTTEGITFQNGQTAINALFDGTEQNVKFSFANVLARHAFKLTFAPYNGGSSYSAFGKFNLYLVDFANQSDYVKLTFGKETDKWVITVNDAKSAKVTESWGGANDMTILEYDIVEKTLNVSGVSISVPTYYNGKDVTFDKGILFNGEFIGVGNCQGVSLYELNNQSLAESKYDYIQPQIDVSRSDCYGEKAFGSVITIGDFFASDVLTPYTVCTYTVQAPSGGFVRSDDGVRLEKIDGASVYTFTVSEYGYYFVTINAVDQNNNAMPISYRITVKDYTPPVIALSEKVTSGKVNNSVAFAKYKVTNDKGSHTAFITVLDPKGTMTYYGAEKSFTPARKGKYTVTVSVIDANGNLTEESYTVTVS